MTYNPNIPTNLQSLGETQAGILTNFANINTAFSANHSPLTTDTTGKHEFLQMPVQASDPAVAASEGGLFVKDDSAAIAQLYIRGEDTGSTYQLTKMASGVDANIATFGTNTAYVANHTGGWTFLPGGLILMYGRRTSLATDSLNTITFPFAFPTAVFSVVPVGVSSGNNTNTTLIRTVTTSNFSIRNTSSGDLTSLYWQAIGN